MNYIIGKKFDIIITNNSIHNNLNNKRKLRLLNEYPLFENNSKYELYFIKNAGEKIEYTFRNCRDFKIFTYEFDSTYDAENMIAVLSDTNEELNILRKKIETFDQT